jgi:hypothetical protein
LSAGELAEKFFGHVEAGEVDEILGMMTPGATQADDFLAVANQEN